MSELSTHFIDEIKYKLRADLDRNLSAAVSKGIPGAVALAADRHGVFYEGAAGVRAAGEAASLDAESVLTLFSCTKAITAVAALQLWERGELDLDAPAREYAPELSTLQVLEGFDGDGAPQLRAPRSEITTRSLLLHTAGHELRFSQCRLCEVEGAARREGGARTQS